jgi:hypothetical protein
MRNCEPSFLDACIGTLGDGLVPQRRCGLVQDATSPEAINGNVLENVRVCLFNACGV